MFIHKILFTGKQRSRLTDVYRMHQNMHSIAGSENRDFIYRVFEKEGHAIVISKTELTGAMVGDVHVQTKKYNPSPISGNKYRFTVKLASIARNDKKEFAVSGHEEIVNLLNSKLKASGSGNVLSAQVNVSEFEKVKKNGSEFDIFSASISGILEVGISSEMKSILLHGIGRKKGFGFGLIMLKPI